MGAEAASAIQGAQKHFQQKNGCKDVLPARTSLTLIVKALISDIKYTVKVDLGHFWVLISKEVIAP